MNIPLLDLKAQYAVIKEEIRTAIDEVLESQHFILGPKVKELEEMIAAYCNCKYALGVSSGTDAILLALMGLGIGPYDIVITTPYTFFATVGCPARLGATVKFVDIDINTYNMDPSALEDLLNSMDAGDRSRVKAVIPVHLFGQMADMGAIMEICGRYGIPVVEDAAQAIGAEYSYQGQVRKAGTIGSVGCFSFFPSKNLGCYGDGGMVVTNDEKLYKMMKLLRAHGSDPKYYHKYVGGNFRLDEIQAAVLIIKLKYLDGWSRARQNNAEKYNNLFNGYKNVIALPAAVYKDERLTNFHIYNQYVIRVKKRDDLKQYLKENGIQTEIYYPVPMHIQECFSNLGYVAGDFTHSEEAARESLALPVYPELKEDEIKTVSETVLGCLNSRVDFMIGS